MRQYRFTGTECCLIENPSIDLRNQLLAKGHLRRKDKVFSRKTYTICQLMRVRYKKRQ